MTETFQLLERAVAGLLGIALVAGMGNRCQRKDRGGSKRHFQHHAHPCGIRPRRLAMILSNVRLGNTAAITSRIGSGVIV
jgi:hypothetical protein